MESIENKIGLLVPPIAGFWRRVAAFIVDGLLLGVIGQIIGWSASSFWFDIGPNGRILGLVIVLLYFGILNSKMGNGQTVGKRLLKTAVRDKNNKPISFQRSLIRISILALPALLNGWALPGLDIFILDLLVGIIVFGVGAAIVYTMIFNRGSRQGIHDLICETYVVHLKTEEIEAFPVAARKHWIVSGVLLVLAVIIISGMTIYEDTIISKLGISDITRAQEILDNDSRFHTVSVGQKVTHVVSNIAPDGYTAHSITVEVWYKGVLLDEEYSDVMDGVAEIVLGNVDNIDQYDNLQVIVMSAYDLGIASRHKAYMEKKSIDEWRVK
jgi:uncharacterized RDD family membrane protein YckC